MEADRAPSVWGTCRTCGTAVAPGARTCALCGGDRPIAAGGLSSAPRAVRRRVALTNWLRGVLVVGVAVALGYTLVGAALSGPPTVADPLTTTGTYTLGPGSRPILSGDVTGGDYVIGNFTSLRPYAANVELSAYNSSGWVALLQNRTSSPVWTTPVEGSGRIVFGAEYTDTYTFVLTNPYPAATHLNITVYVATQYESNVGDDGFG
jgi:hypothetical protein